MDIRIRGYVHVFSHICIRKIRINIQPLFMRMWIFMRYPDVYANIRIKNPHLQIRFHKSASTNPHQRIRKYQIRIGKICTSGDHY